MDNTIIPVRYDLHILEVTRHTNRKVIVTLCWDCLCKSKTNKEYLAYSKFPSISSVRVCSKCGAMTPSAIANAFSLPLQRLILCIENGDIIHQDDTDKFIMFVAEPSTILSMKASMKNGKKRG